MVTPLRISTYLESGQEFTELERWREGILRKVLVMTLVLGVVAYIPGVYLAVTRGSKVITVVEGFALAFVALITFLPSLPFRYRAGAFLAVTYCVGLWFLVAVGVVSQIYLLSFPILTALFCGFRPALAALVLNGVTVAVVGYFVTRHVYLPGLVTEGVLRWTIVSLNFILIDSVLTVATALLLQKVELSFRTHLVASIALEHRQRELVQANDALAAEMEVRRNAETRARQLAQAVEQARDIILMTDADGKITYANHALDAIWGKSGETMPAIPFAEFLAFDDRGNSIASLLKERRAWAGTLEFTAGDGDVRQMETFISPARDGDGKVTNVVAILRDVTREREIEGRMRQSQKLEAMGTFAGGIAHDFNNILGSILGLAELSQQQARNTPLEENLEGIVNACNRARDIVRQMMVFSRQGSQQRANIALKAVLEETMPLLRAAIPAAVNIRADLRSDGGVIANAGEIQQVLMNLATNASHAMEETGGGVLRISLGSAHIDKRLARSYPGLTLGARYMCLEVSDTGHGITPELLDKIFDPFFTTREGIGGTGLGLASVHGIVSSLGGEIGVTSKVGKGTTFRIFLPEVDAPDKQHSAPASEPARGHGRVLLVEDEESLLRLGASILTSIGYEVASAPTGEAALEIVNSDPNPFDILVTDLSMPGMSGAELIRQMRCLRPDVRVILTSGFVDKDNAALIESMDLEIFLPKPYTRRELVDHVSAALASHV